MAGPSDWRNYLSSSSLVYQPEVLDSNCTFMPYVKLPSKALDCRDVLSDVFSAYLSPKVQMPYQGLEEEMETEEIEKTDEGSLKFYKYSDEPKKDKLGEFFKIQTPSLIRSELTNHFNRLKDPSKPLKSPTMAERCNHLPKGFSDDHVVPTKQVTCYQKKPTSVIKDEDFSLIIEPSEILFDTYAVGHTYKKRCWIRNRSGQIIKGRIVQPSNFEWSIDHSGKMSLSTGLSIQIIVSFTPKDVKPKSSSMSFILSKGSLSKKKVFVVPIIARRLTPSLEGFIVEESHVRCVKYLDAGKTWLNYNKNTKVVLTNKGSVSNFILTPDTLSTFSQLKNDDNEECAYIGPFSLKPCQFILEKDQSIELKLSFRPLSKEEFVQNMKIVCTDDICCDEFEIVGKGVTLSREDILFDVSLQKSYDIGIEDDWMAEYYLDFGKLFPKGKRGKTITILNTSVMPLKYHWEYREAKINLSDHYDLPECSLDIKLKSGIIQPQSVKKFKFTCTTSSAHPGIYKAVLSLIIDDVSKECLDQVDESFLIKPKNSSQKNKNIVSVNCGEIELWLEVVLPQVLISPGIIEMSLSDSKPSDLMMVQVQNVSHDAVTVQWKRGNTTIYSSFYWQLVIDPDGPVKIAENQTFNFRLKSCVSKASCFDIDCFEETLFCLVNKCETFIEVKVTVDLIKDELGMKDEVAPEMEGDSSISCRIAFTFPPKDLIHLQPTNRGDLMQTLEARIREVVNDFNSRRKCLKFNNSYVKQVFDSAMACVASEGLVLAVLEWDGELNWVIADLRGYDVSLNPKTLNVSLFHQFHDKSSVSIYNRSLLTTKYRWGESFGNDTEMLKLWLKKSEGVLEPNSKTDVDLFIFPSNYGEVEDLKIPCYVDNVSEPIILTVKGMIEPLRILLQWNVDDGFYETSWDPTQSDSVFSKIFKQSSRLEDELGGALSGDFLHALGTSSLLKIVNELKEGMYSEMFCSRNKAEADMSKLSLNPGVSDIDGENFMLISDSCGALGCNRIEHIVCQVLRDKALHFNLNLGQSVTEYVIIKNMTPILTSFTVKAEIFSSDEEAPEYPLFFGEDLSELSNNSLSLLNKLKEEKTKKIGLHLMVNPHSRELNSYKEIAIAVTATADVWGDYVDVLVVSVLGLPTFSIPVSVLASGPPISFTFDPRPQPHFRFGTLTPNEKASYEVFLRNNTYVPLKVTWNLYCKPFQKEGSSESEQEMPFGLMTDFHDVEKGNFCKMALTQYYGHQMDNPYQLSPRVVYLLPYDEVRMNLSVKIPEDSEEGLLEGYCVGLIYEDIWERMKWRSLCQRVTGLDLMFELKMTTQVEIPSIQIISEDNTNRHLCFKVLAKEVAKKGGMVIPRRLIMKNMSRAETQVSLLIQEPFHLHDVQPKDEKELKFVKGKHPFILHPHQKIAVFIELKLTKEVLEQDQERFNWESDEILQATKRSSIFIHQPFISKTQEVTLKYEIIYPYLRFSTKRMVFGPVFVNEVKVKVLRITSVTGKEDIKIVNGDDYSPGESPFSFSHSSAHLEQGAFIEVAIHFAPRESTGYLEEIEIKTSVPWLSFYVVLEGVGTWNYKFHQIVKP